MLENDLSFLKLKLTILKIAMPLISIIVIVWYLMNNGDDKNPMIGLMILVVITGLVSAYIIFTTFIRKKALDNYIIALKNKDMEQALTYGRIYYGMKRDGIKGAGGDFLHAVDEGAINNDINVYSK